jgi:uncharacterized membrane protein YfcA
MSLPQLFPYMNEVVVALLGLFIGVFAAFVGNPGGSALVTYLILVFGILPSQTVIAGTLLYVSCIPLGLIGLHEYVKNKSVNFYIGNFLILGTIAGIYYGSKYSFVVNKAYGERYGDKLKFGITSVLFLVLSVLYGKRMLER